MFPPQKLPNKRPRYQTLPVPGFSGGVIASRDENLLPYAYAAKAYNFRYRDGALRDGTGFERIGRTSINNPLTVPATGSPIKKLWHYKRANPVTGAAADEILAWCADGYIYAYRIRKLSPLTFENTGMQFFAEPDAVNYRLNSEDVILFSASGAEMAVYNGIAATNYPNAPKLSHMEVHSERLFAVVQKEPERLYFSEVLNPTGWEINLTGAGFIDFADGRGAIIKLVSFLDYLYVFREFGITRVTAFGDQTQFWASNLFTSGGRILGGTVALCGNAVIFAASDGIYAFDGFSANKILPELSERLNFINPACAYFDGKYYISASFDYKDGEQILDEANGSVVSTIIEYDPRNGEFCLTRGFDTAHMCVYAAPDAYFLLFAHGKDTQGYAYYMTGEGKFLNAVLPKNWTSPYSDLGRPDKYKVIKELSFISRVPCVVTVKTDERAESFEVPGSPSVARLRPNVGGRLVSVAFDALNADSCISRPVLTVAVS